MPAYGYVGLYRAIYGCLSLRMAMWGYLWVFMAIDALHNSDFRFPVARKRGLGCIFDHADCHNWKVWKY